MNRIMIIKYKNSSGIIIDRKYITTVLTIQEAMAEMQKIADKLVSIYGGEIISIQEGQ